MWEFLSSPKKKDYVKLILTLKSLKQLKKVNIFLLTCKWRNEKPAAVMACLFFETRTCAPCLSTKWYDQIAHFCVAEALPKKLKP